MQKSVAWKKRVFLTLKSGYIVFFAVLPPLIWWAIMKPTPVSDFEEFLNQIRLLGQDYPNTLALEGKSPGLVFVYGSVGEFLGIQEPWFFQLLSIFIWTCSTILIILSLRLLGVKVWLVSLSVLLIATNVSFFAYASTISSEPLAMLCVSAVVYISAQYLNPQTPNKLQSGLQMHRRRFRWSHAILLAIAVAIVYATRLNFLAALIPFLSVLMFDVLKRRTHPAPVALSFVLSGILVSSMASFFGRISPNSNWGLLALFGTNRDTKGGWNQGDIDLAGSMSNAPSPGSLNEVALELALSRIGSIPDYLMFFLRDKLPTLFSSFYEWSIGTERIIPIADFFLVVAPIAHWVSLLLYVSFLSFSLLNLTRAHLRGLDFADKNLLKFGIIWFAGAVLLAAPHILIEVQGRYSLPLLISIIIVAATWSTLGHSNEKVNRRTFIR